MGISVNNCKLNYAPIATELAIKLLRIRMYYEIINRNDVFHFYHRYAVVIEVEVETADAGNS